jgi:hypothetical protein
VTARATKLTSLMNIYQVASPTLKVSQQAQVMSSCPTITYNGNHGRPTLNMILDGSGIPTTNNKSKQTMAHKQFLELILHQASAFKRRRHFISPWHISVSSCGPLTRTSAGLSCTCAQSQGREDHLGWDQSAGNRWKARPVEQKVKQHLNKWYSSTPDNIMMLSQG